MSIQNQINRISNAKKNIANAIESKGVTVPANTKIDGYASLIDSIEAGGGGSAEDLDAIITELENKVATLNNTLDDKASGGGGSTETCTVYLTTEDIVFTLAYHNGNEWLVEESYQIENNRKLTIRKGSALEISYASDPTYGGSIHTEGEIVMVSNDGYVAFFGIEGNGTIEITNNTFEG